MNKYCMLKGVLITAAPFKPSYVGNPHYVISVKDDEGKTLTIVFNSASTEIGQDGDSNVYFYADLNFDDPINSKLGKLNSGVHTDGFPRLDYWQDSSLLDLKKMRPIPFKDEDGNHADINDSVSDALSIDTSKTPKSLPFDNGSGKPQMRDFYDPTDDNVTVYGFGFLFPTRDGLHETHMNQGNPRGRHWKENGAFQDGAVIIERGGTFIALFTAFQTQYVPTDARGFPLPNSLPLPQFIRG